MEASGAVSVPKATQRKLSTVPMRRGRDWLTSSLFLCGSVDSFGQVGCRDDETCDGGGASAGYSMEGSTGGRTSWRMLSLQLALTRADSSLTQVWYRFHPEQATPDRCRETD